MTTPSPISQSGTAQNRASRSIAPWSSGTGSISILAMLTGCGLRRGELLALRVDAIQLREEHWVVADLLGKAGHIRTIPIPAWVKAAVDAWKEASGITQGTLFRSIHKAGKVWGKGMTPRVLWEIVREGASRAGIEKLAPQRFATHLREALPLGRRRAY